MCIACKSNYNDWSYYLEILDSTDKHFKPAWACFRVLGQNCAAGLFAFRGVWALKFGYQGDQL